MSFSRAQQNRARGYAGVAKLRKTLRRLDPEITNGVRSAINKVAKAVHADIMINGQSHRITGDMLASVSINYGRDGLTALIGPGAEAITVNKSPFNTTLYKSQSSKWNAWQFFKAYWIEFGTKGSPENNIPALPAQPFVQPAWDSNKAWGIDEVKRAVSIAVRTAASE